MSPNAAAARLHGPLCPWAPPIWLPLGSGVSQCGPSLGRGDPAAAPKVPGKAWSRGACLTRAKEEVREQGPALGTRQVLAAQPLCSRLVRSPPTSAPGERVEALRDTGAKASASCPGGGQLEEPARARGNADCPGDGPGALPPAQVFGRTSSSGSPSPGWAVATVLLGEGDSGDLGQRLGQASRGEGGLERDTHTPASTHTTEHAQVQGTLMSPLLSFALWCQDPAPPPVTHPVTLVTCEGTRGTRQLLFCWPTPRAALSSEGAATLRPSPSRRSGRVGTQRGQPSPSPRPSVGLDCLSGLSQARSWLRAGPDPQSCAHLPGFPAQWGWRSGQGLASLPPPPYTPCPGRSSDPQGPCLALS